MIEFNRYIIDEKKIIGISDIKFQYKKVDGKELKRAYCQVYLINYKINVFTHWDDNNLKNINIDKDNVIRFINLHTVLCKSIKNLDFVSYNKFNQESWQRYMKAQLKRVSLLKPKPTQKATKAKAIKTT